MSDPQTRPADAAPAEATPSGATPAEPTAAEIAAAAAAAEAARKALPEPERRAYNLSILKQVRGDIVATLFETSTTAEIESFVGSLRKTAALLRERMPDDVVPGSADAGTARPPGAVTTAAAATTGGAPGAGPAVRPAAKAAPTGPSPEDIRRDLLAQATKLLEEAGRAAATATTPELEGLILTLKSGLAKISRKPVAAEMPKLTTPGLMRVGSQPPGKT